jgi:phosphate-selective porin OprO and OprP
MLRRLGLFAAVCVAPGFALAQQPDAAPVPDTQLLPVPAPAQPAAPAQPVAPAQPIAPAPHATQAQQPSEPQPPTQPPSPAPAPAIEPAQTVQPEPASQMDPRPVEGVRYVPGKGFEQTTADGDFALALGAWMQVRYTWNGLEGDDRHAVELSRTRLVLSGHLWGPNTSYALELGLAGRELDRSAVRAGGVASEQDVLKNGPVLNAYLDFRQLRDLSVRAGQFKVPFSRQQLASERELAGVERGLTDVVFALGRDIGIDLYSDDLFGLDLLRYHAGVYGGEGRNGWERTIGAGDHGFLYDVRLELLPLGVFDEFTEVDFERGPARLSVGAAYALLQADATSPLAALYIEEPFDAGGAPAVVDFNAHNFTADAMFMVAGLTAHGAFHLRKVADVPGGLDGMGFLIAASYLLPDIPLAPGASYALVRGDDGSPLADNDELVLLLGYFLAEHLLKIQLDYSRLWNDAGFGAGNDRVRLQLQASL